MAIPEYGAAQPEQQISRLQHPPRLHEKWGTIKWPAPIHESIPSSAHGLLMGVYQNDELQHLAITINSPRTQNGEGRDFCRTVPYDGLETAMKDWTVLMSAGDDRLVRFRDTGFLYDLGTNVLAEEGANREKFLAESGMPVVFVHPGEAGSDTRFKIAGYDERRVSTTLEFMKEYLLIPNGIGCPDTGKWHKEAVLEKIAQNGHRL